MTWKAQTESPLFKPVFLVGSDFLPNTTPKPFEIPRFNRFESPRRRSSNWHSEWLVGQVAPRRVAFRVFFFVAVFDRWPPPRRFPTFWCFFFFFRKTVLGMDRFFQRKIKRSWVKVFFLTGTYKKALERVWLPSSFISWKRLHMVEVVFLTAFGSRMKEQRTTKTLWYWGSD